MDAAKRRALEAGGWVVGDAQEFLGLTDEEARLIDLRVGLAGAIRRRREANGLSQRQLAERVGSSQPRIAHVERAAPGVSLDLMVRVLFALGGSMADLAGTDLKNGITRRQKASAGRGGARTRRRA